MNLYMANLVAFSLWLWYVFQKEGYSLVDQNIETTKIGPIANSQNTKLWTIY